MKSMIKDWEKSLNKLSNNFTTNEYMPNWIKGKLLKEDLSLVKEISFEKVSFPNLKGSATKIKGLNILSGLQSLHKKNCLTLFRAIRFPTIYRMHNSIYNFGFTILNYEQERILALYKNKDYISKRRNIQKDKNFWIQPQERVVKGLPVFYLINDALQIHRAFRNKLDRVLIIAIYIPFNLIKKGKIKIYANLDIELDYKNNKRDVEIKDFVNKNGYYFIDTSALNLKGINLYELYLKRLSFNMKKANGNGINRRAFLLDIYKINHTDARIKKLRGDLPILKKYHYFLNGFFGDYNLFGRRPFEYLPYACYEVKRKI